GVFQLALLHNGRRVTIMMTFDFDEGTVSYSTTVSSGMKAGFHPPRDLARFFRPEFVPFFVFDGELAERLLSREHTNAESVIDDLFQLRLFDSVADHVRDYWKAQTERAGATEERGLSRRTNRVSLLRTRLGVLLAEQSARRQRREELDALL